MALIDVSELMIDVDFVDHVVIIHRTPTVNTLGENVLTETIVNTLGSVQPASGKTLMRLPEALRIQSVSSFWIKGQIISDGMSAYPDIIAFQGQRYEVQMIADWLNWPANQGWCTGIAVRERPTL